MFSAGLFFGFTGAASPGLEQEISTRWLDLDGDGRADLQLAASDENDDGTFDDVFDASFDGIFDGFSAPPGTNAVPASPLEFELSWDSGSALNNVWHMAVYDFDGDGSKNILSMVFSPSKQLYLYENTADDTFELSWVSPAPGPPGAFVTVTGGDSDSDGYSEIIGGETSTLNQVLLYEAAGVDTFEFRDIDVSEPDFTGNLSMDRVLVADTDGDSIMEIIFDTGSVGGGKVFIYEQDGPVGQNTYTKVYEYDTVSYLFDLAVGDSDNDGNQEIILGVGGMGGFPLHLRRLEYNPVLETYEHKMVEPGVTGLPLAPSVEDVDGDGLNEIVMGTTLTGGGGIYIFEATADDEYTWIYESPFPLNGNVLTTTVGPLTDAAYPGIVAGSFGGELMLYGFDGEVYQELLEQPITSGGSIRGSHLGMVDGDDDADIVFSSYGDHRIYVYEQVVLPVVAVTLDPVSTTVPRGENLEFHVALENTTEESQLVWAFTAAYLPGGAPYPDNPLLGPAPITIGPHMTIEADLFHAIPPLAPLGLYNYLGVVGLPPGTLINSDAFDFEVIEGH